MKPATLLFLGGLLAALAVALGAIGAHALKPLLSPQQLETFHTAVQYQMVHAVGLVLVGLVSLHKRSRLADLAGWAMLLGIVLFSGFLYAWLATGVKACVHVVPIGGTAFILAWLLLAVAGARMAKQG
jgi:uncharacterized membrane protein YgdD (TMEM256/DUF423 family)